MRITRPAAELLEPFLGRYIRCLDHGFVILRDYMGNEQSIVESARISYGKGTRSVNEDKSLLRYLLRHRHTTPFEMCEIKVHMKLPIFVARQLIRHRTANVNEMSARYSVLDNEFYVPAPEQLAAQSTTNKQGRGEILDAEQAEWVLRAIKNESAGNYQAYKCFLNEDKDEEDPYPGLARELSRMALSLNFYTQWVWKIDLHNLMHFLTLRLDEHAQYEIRVYAQALRTLVQAWVPNVYDAFVDYVLGAHTFSRQEMHVIRQFISEFPLAQKEIEAYIDNRLIGTSAREKEAFLNALGVR